MEKSENNELDMFDKFLDYVVFVVVIFLGVGGFGVFLTESILYIYPGFDHGMVFDLYYWIGGLLAAYLSAGIVIFWHGMRTLQ